MTDRVLFWDFERTLAVRNGRWPAALSEALEPHKISMAPDTFLPFLSTGFPWRHPDIPHPDLNTPDAWWTHMHRIFVRIYTEAGLPKDIAEAAANNVRSAYLTFDRWHIYPDTAPALTALTQAGWQHVLLSNHVPELQQIVNAIGLGPHFTAVLTSATLGYEKPNSEIYRLALEHTNNPPQRYMIGDKLDEDVLAPEKAGIPGILVRTADSRAKLAFEDLYGVVRLLSA